MRAGMGKRMLIFPLNVTIIIDHVCITTTINIIIVDDFIPINVIIVIVPAIRILSIIIVIVKEGAAPKRYRKPPAAANDAPTRGAGGGPLPVAGVERSVQARVVGSKRCKSLRGPSKRYKDKKSLYNTSSRQVYLK